MIKLYCYILCKLQDWSYDLGLVSLSNFFVEVAELTTPNDF